MFCSPRCYSQAVQLWVGFLEQVGQTCVGGYYDVHVWVSQHLYEQLLNVCVYVGGM